MSKEVQDYIKEQKALLEKSKRKNEKEERDSLLIELGLYTVEYAPEGADTRKYPETEWNEEKQTYVNYRFIPYEITDEEYQELLELQEQDEPSERSANPIAILMIIVAITIFVGGLVLGIVFGKETRVLNSGRYNEETEQVFSFWIALIYWVSAFVGGSLFLGLAEIINRLSSIDEQQ